MYHKKCSIDIYYGSKGEKKKLSRNYASEVLEQNCVVPRPSGK
jgi:hypothetical protein